MVAAPSYCGDQQQRDSGCSQQAPHRSLFLLHTRGRPLRGLESRSEASLAIHAHDSHPTATSYDTAKARPPLPPHGKPHDSVKRERSSQTPTHMYHHAFSFQCCYTFS